MALASGELTRREDATEGQPAIDFNERFARRLRLTITDDRNPPLSIVSVTAMSATRQVVFESAPAAAPRFVFTTATSWPWPRSF